MRYTLLPRLFLLRVHSGRRGSSFINGHCVYGSGRGGSRGGNSGSGSGIGHIEGRFSAERKNSSIRRGDSYSAMKKERVRESSPWSLDVESCREPSPGGVWE